MADSLEEGERLLQHQSIVNLFGLPAIEADQANGGVGTEKGCEVVGLNRRDADRRIETSGSFPGRADIP